MKKFLVYMLCMALGSVVTAVTVFAIIIPHPYPDVDADSYYSSATNKMSAMGIITGYSNGNFGPDDPVLRAQAAVMFYRYNERVDDMQTIICEGIAREDVTNQQIYDEVCPSTEDLPVL